MSRVVFLTRTNWSEPPRLRHQLARLLASYGHSVYFCERPSHNPVAGEVRTEPIPVEEGIHLLRYYEPVHHQLKVEPVSYALSNTIVMRSLRRIEARVQADVVMNFNHDYGFARAAFPSSTFVTVINDDFEGMAKPWIKNATTRRLGRTCKASDIVFAVSEVLAERVSEWSLSAQLLLPWARAYDAPGRGRRRDTVLYYGYINEKVDWKLVESLAREGAKLRFTGPIDPALEHMVSSLSQFANVEFTAPVSLNELDVSDVVCSIVPYDTSLPYVQVMTIGNRVLNLLSCGIPVVHARLPHFLSCPATVVRLCDDVADYQHGVEFFRQHFDSVQDDIREFLRSHSEEERMSQIVQTVPALAEKTNEIGGAT